MGRAGAAPLSASPRPSPARTLSHHRYLTMAPAAGGFRPRGVSTPAPRSLVPRASPASSAPTTRAVRAAGSPRAKEDTELRAELAVLREAAGGHATERLRDQYERGKRAKLEDEVVRADVSELVLTSALDEANAQAAAALRTLEQSRAGSQFGAMQSAQHGARHPPARLAARVRHRADPAQVQGQ
mmetsp:Transcript_24569/g.58070  ORF Transcript_24569/g.58070 Transcript_24569/m.58070 type:complete len:185 (+) Transcript_24569:162-716(+)